MNRLSLLYILLVTTIGCTGRHVVVDPEEMSGLDKGTWTILKEPSQDLNQQEVIDMR
jgi:hypothetical protein